jgi:serine O-acetyltransferase
VTSQPVPERGLQVSLAADGLSLAMSRAQLGALVERQLGNLFFFDHATESAELAAGIDHALGDVHVCFRPIKNKYYRKSDLIFFDPMHSGQYSIFLYYLARWIASRGLTNLADRIYYLNKALNGFDLFHGVKMPTSFFVDHPVGAVIGRAVFGPGFVFCQNCTVGNSHGVFPVFEREVTMFAGSSVIGNCRIGERTIIGAGTLLVDRDVPPYSVVTGRGNAIVVRPMAPGYFDQYSYFERDLLAGYAD